MRRGSLMQRPPDHVFGIDILPALKDGEDVKTPVLF